MWFKQFEKLTRYKAVYFDEIVQSMYVVAYIMRVVIKKMLAIDKIMRGVGKTMLAIG